MASSDAYAWHMAAKQDPQHIDRQKQISSPLELAPLMRQSHKLKHQDMINNWHVVLHILLQAAAVI